MPTNINIQNSTNASLTLQTGVTPVLGGDYWGIDATTAAYPGGPERIELIGTLGTASLVGTALDVHFADGRREQLAADATPGGTGADPMAFPHDYHLGVWRDFLDALDQGGPPRVCGAEALKVHRLIDSLLEAGATGQKIDVR